jgi:hypothetical protein
MVRQIVEAAIKAGAIIRPHQVLSKDDFLKAISSPTEESNPKGIARKGRREL